jgi:hypothetical protein
MHPKVRRRLPIVLIRPAARPSVPAAAAPVAPANPSPKRALDVDAALAAVQGELAEESRVKRETAERAASYQLLRARAEPPTTNPTASMTQAPAPFNRPQVAQGPRLEPAAWLEQIRTLRREGKVVEADDRWREFVAAYPDFEVDAKDPARPGL